MEQSQNPKTVDIEVEQITDWLWCLRSPIVQAYALSEGDGFNLVDTGIAGSHEGILHALGELAGSAPSEVPIGQIFLTHGHDDHSGSAAALVHASGARVLRRAPRGLIGPRGTMDPVASPTGAL